MSLVISVSKNLLDVITVQNSKGISYKYISRIIQLRMRTFRYWLDWSITINILFLIGYPRSEAVGIVLFVLTSLKLIPSHERVLKLEKYYVHTYRQEEIWIFCRIMLFTIFVGHIVAGLLLVIANSENENWL